MSEQKKTPEQSISAALQAANNLKQSLDNVEYLHRALMDLPNEAFMRVALKNMEVNEMWIDYIKAKWQAASDTREGVWDSAKLVMTQKIVPSKQKLAWRTMLDQACFAADHQDDEAFAKEIEKKNNA